MSARADTWVGPYGSWRCASRFYGSRRVIHAEAALAMDWIALWLSVRLAAATTLVLLAIGVPLAYWIVFSPRRWKFLVEAIVALPLVLPPTVLGFYVLVAIGPLSPVGRAYARIAGQGLPFTFEGLLIASVLYSMPFAVQPFAVEFASVDRRLLEASWSLGVSMMTSTLLPSAKVADEAVLPGTESAKSGPRA